jgi:rfaE bifunctional protein nucleotidyltransferase chain/domain
MKDKIYTLEELIIRRQSWKKQNKKVVFTNGCFDLIHRGHLQYLAQAKELGDKLIVAINSDISVKILKGENRPIKPEIDRLLTMAAFSFVDAVVLFEEETPTKLIDALIPDILVKGGDYEIEKIVGYKTVTQHGGQVLTLDFVAGSSTSNFVEKLKN